jgi:pectin methylesterase-like acyl-CoA thioesterase
MKAFGSSLSVALALGVALLAAAAMTPARAGLGDTVAAVQADRMSMKGQLRARSEAGYSVEEITAASGTVVREYVSPSGVVFAVSWSGPAMPNLQQALGTYFTQYQSAVQARHAQGLQHFGHNHLQIRTPSLVVHAGGHMRQYFGVAYVPSLMPANLALSDLH